jgi:tRNA (Thr-GGU) A37 N-methylase
MPIEMEPIGFVSTDTETIPRSWSVSDVKGTLVINESYVDGLRDIKPGQRIYVIFHFHKSPNFTSQFMRISRSNREEKVGVFSTHFTIPTQPYRPVTLRRPWNRWQRRPGQRIGHVGWNTYSGYKT